LQEPIPDRGDAVAGRGCLAAKRASALSYIGLERRHIDETLHRGMGSRLSDNHSAVAMAHEYARARCFQNTPSRGHIFLEARQGLLNDADRIPVTFEHVCYRLPPEPSANAPCTITTDLTPALARPVSVSVVPATRANTEAFT